MPAKISRTSVVNREGSALAEIIALRLIHILGGIFWVGVMLFNVLFLFPAMAAIGPAAGPLMGELQRRRLMTVLPFVAILTMVSGMRLMWITSGGFSPDYFSFPTGRALAVGAVAAVAGFLVGIGVGRPAAMRAAQLGASLASVSDAAERAAMAGTMSAVRRRAAMANAVTMILLVISAGAMAIARYLG